MINNTSIGNTNAHHTNPCTTNSTTADISAHFGARLVSVVQDVVRFLGKILKATFNIMTSLLSDMSVEHHFRPSRTTWLIPPETTVVHYYRCPCYPPFKVLI